MKNSKLIWLWLEDEPNAVRDIEVQLVKNDIVFEKFKNQNDLFKKLIELKRLNDLIRYGLLFDIMLTGNPFIMIPADWSGKDYIEYVPTARGYNAGLLLYKEAIIDVAKNFWKPLPPIIFLTVTFEDSNTRGLLDEMKMSWAELNNESSDQAKVKTYRKNSINEQSSEFWNNIKNW